MCFSFIQFVLCMQPLVERLFFHIYVIQTLKKRSTIDTVNNFKTNNTLFQTVFIFAKILRFSPYYILLVSMETITPGLMKRIAILSSKTAQYMASDDSTVQHDHPVA